MTDHLIRGEETHTSSMDDETSFDITVFDTAVRNCFERLDKLVTRLHRYPLDAVPVAMGTYFQELLGAMFDDGACTVEDVRAFLRDIESGVLEPKYSHAENIAVPVSSAAPRSASGAGQTD
jgi:hypothetical protein